MGMTSITIRYFGILPPYMNAIGGEGLILCHMGESLSEKTAINYLFESLWDFRSSENNGLKGDYYLYVESHNNHWTEENHKKRFGSFFFDYVFTMSPDTGLNAGKGFCLYTTSRMMPPVLIDQNQRDMLTIT